MSSRTWCDILLMAIIVISAADTSDADRCGIVICLRDFEKIVNNSNLAFAQNEEELDSLCRHLNQTLRCVSDFITHCIPSDLRRQYADQIAGTLILIDKLCKRHSPFRTKFLKHAHCYTRLAKDYNKCNSEFHEKEKVLFEEATSQANPAVQNEKWCCIFDLHRKCTREAVESTCGTEAADIADQVTVVSVGEPAKVYCSNLTVTSVPCSQYIASSSVSGSSRSHHQVSVLLLVLLLLLHRSSCRTLRIQPVL